MTRYQLTNLTATILFLTLSGCGGALFNKKSDANSAAKTAPKPADMKDAPPAKINPTTHFAAGQMHEREGHLLAAAEQYRRATKADPKYVMAFNRLGIVCDKLKMFDEADAAFSAAVKLSPESAFLWNNFAFSRMLQGDYERAEGSLNEALKLNPTYVRARINLGVVQTRTHRTTDAVETFAKVLPRDVALYNVGVLCVVDHRYNEARNAFTQVMAINPDAIDARRQLGKLKQLETNPSDALKSELAMTAERIMGRLGPAPRPTGVAVAASQPTVAAKSAIKTDAAITVRPSTVTKVAQVKPPVTTTLKPTVVTKTVNVKQSTTKTKLTVAAKSLNRPAAVKTPGSRPVKATMSSALSAVAVDTTEMDFVP